MNSFINPEHIYDLNPSQSSWGGNYPALNNFFSLLMKNNGGKNNIFLGGDPDMHFTILADVFTFNGQEYRSISCYSDNFKCKDSKRLGVEVISSSGSRGNIDEKIFEILRFKTGSILNRVISNFVEKGFKRSNPHFKKFDGTLHGYAIIEFFEESMKTEMKYFDILEKDFNKSKQKGYFQMVKRNSNKLQ